MGCTDCCAKAFLVTINIIVMVLGIVFLAGGLFLKFGQTLLLSTVSAMLQSATDSAKAAGISVGSTSDLAGIFDTAAYVLIAVGAFSFVIAIIGCAGACCSVKVLLGIYAAVVLLMFIAMIILIALLASKSIDPQLFSAMELDLKQNYQGPTAFNTQSMLLNSLMVQLSCCGIESYAEFQSASKWNRTITYTASGVTYSVDQQIPMTCCKVTGSFPAITPIDNNCTITPTSANSNIDTNCHNAVQAQIDLYKVAIYGTYAAVLAFELACGAVAICLLVRMKNKENKVHPSDKKPKGSHHDSQKNSTSDVKKH